MALANTGAALQHLTPRPVKGLFGTITCPWLTWTLHNSSYQRYTRKKLSVTESVQSADSCVWLALKCQWLLTVSYGLSKVACTLHMTALAQLLMVLTITLTGLPTGTDPSSLIGVGQTLVISNGTVTAKARVDSMGAYTSGANSTSTQVVNIKVYGEAGSALPAALRGATTSLNIFVFGSEYAKGSGDVGNSFDASFTTFENKPIILRDKYNVNGSDVAQIGWVEVTTEAGTGGYLWYLKSEHESRLRFEDYLEMSMVETEKAVGAIATGVTGSEGMFEAIEDRGLVYNATDFGGANGLGQFDEILAELDKQGAIEENMMFLDRATSLGIDNMLAAQNSYGAGGTSYGVFDNSEDMALNLGFSGFRRGSYDFYKTDWKYLNDSTTRGSIGDIEGVMVPAGTSTVYDEQLGTNISRPFLHIRYRANEAEDRRMKSWITGSVGGNFTSAVDEMNVHFLSERALCVQAANNFVLLK